MKLLVLDGNSILNRAFYGIKLLTTKSGEYTNGIYGFLTMLKKLLDETGPDGWLLLLTGKRLLSGIKPTRDTNPTARVCLRSLPSSFRFCRNF